MGWLSNLARQRMLNWVFLDSAPTRPTALFAALFTTMPAKDGTGGVECSGTGYAREEITAAFTGATAANPSAVTTDTEIDFGTGAVDWGTIVGVGWFDASTSGNLWGAHQLADAVVVTAAPVTIAAGAFDVSL